MNSVKSNHTLIYFKFIFSIIGCQLRVLVQALIKMLHELVVLIT
jgi:hypothetical protein